MLDTIQAGWDTTPSDLTGNTWFQYDRYTRDPVGNVTVIEDRGLEPGGAGSNIKECFVYDEWNRLVRAHTAPGTTDGSETVGCATSTGTNITARGATSPYDRTWSFDDINRITGSADKANGNATTTWGYSSTKHAVLSLTGQTSGSYSYNTVGAMVSRNGDTLTYDPQQRLTGYDTSSVDDTYLYTTSNQRLIRQHGSTVTLYLGDMEIGYDGTNTTVTRYISIAGTQVATRTTLNSGTATIAWNCGNIQNSTICQAPAATTPSPPIPGRKRYTPYGDDRNTTPYTNTDHGYLGQPEDATGLTYLNFRYYDPPIAAFISVDPLVGETGTPYAYGNLSPIRFSDPSGMEFWECGPGDCNEAVTNAIAESPGFKEYASEVEEDPTYLRQQTEACVDRYRTCQANWTQQANSGHYNIFYLFVLSNFISQLDKQVAEDFLFDQGDGSLVDTNGARVTTRVLSKDGVITIVIMPVPDEAWTIGVSTGFCIIVCLEIGISSEGPYIKPGFGLAYGTPQLIYDPDDAPECGSEQTVVFASVSVGPAQVSFQNSRDDRGIEWNGWEANASLSFQQEHASNPFKLGFEAGVVHNWTLCP